MIKLTNKLGQVIPAIGLGTFPFQGREMADIIKKAVNIGYRIFDTADDYRGEGGIGIAMSELQKEGICREELFIQTKISDNNAHDDEPLKGIYFNPNSQFMKRHSVEELVREKIATSLRELRTSYIDSLLIHYPFPEYRYLRTHFHSNHNYRILRFCTYNTVSKLQVHHSFQQCYPFQDHNNEMKSILLRSNPH